MKYLALLCLTVSLIAPPAHAQPLYTCGQGTVLAVQFVSDVTATRTFGPLQNDNEAGLPEIETEQRRDGHYLVTVELTGTVYTGRARADAPENFDPTSLAANETIAACINDTQMVLDRLDGKDFRAKVVRVERRMSRAF